MYSILTRKKARRQTRLERATATELVQRAVIKRSLYFLKLFKETLDEFYNSTNWAIKTIHAKGCVTWYVPSDSCNCTPLTEEYTWLGKDPHELINEVFAKWEERNGPIQAIEESSKELQETSSGGDIPNTEYSDGRVNEESGDGVVKGATMEVVEAGGGC